MVYGGWVVIVTFIVTREPGHEIWLKEPCEWGQVELPLNVKMCWVKGEATDNILVGHIK